MRLLAAISHHGLGHLAQAAPVLTALHELQPALELEVWSGLHLTALSARIPFPFTHRHEPADVGLVMHDAVRVDVAASGAAYLAFHRDWNARVVQEATWMRGRKFQGVFADAACLPLAAAAAADIPGIALCSLNWVDIAGAYLAEHPGMEQVLTDMAAAYQSARAFLRATPAMPMDWLGNRETLAPIAARGKHRGAELHAVLGDDRMVLIGFGGIGYQATAHLPTVPGVRWLVPDDWRQERLDVIPFARIGWPFIDLLASADALITKVGYGSFVEAAAAAVPVLYIDRPDWPETPFLSHWLAQHGRASAITEADLFSEEVGERLAHLWQLPPCQPCATPGATAAAQRLLEIVGSGSAFER